MQSIPSSLVSAVRLLRHLAALLLLCVGTLSPSLLSAQHYLAPSGPPAADSLPPNPTANAGSDRITNLGRPVVLDGTLSADHAGLPLTYHWSIVSSPVGSAVHFEDSTLPMPTLVDIDTEGTYSIQLVVSDKNASSKPSIVTVSTYVTAPVAAFQVVDPNGEIYLGQLAQLDGSLSTDPNDAQLSYSWSILTAPPGSQVTLSSTTAVRPSFTPDVYGLYTFQLTVKDKYLTSRPYSLYVSTSTVPPVASAGRKRSTSVGQTVLLDGSASRDPSGLPFQFAWTLLSKPAASATALVDPNGIRPSLFIDAPGTYVAQLIVSDSFYDSEPVTVTIATNMLPPVADAGKAQHAALHHPVQLDGTASFDTTDLPLTYSWLLLSQPAGSTAVLSSKTAAQPSLTPDVYGTYVVQLTVNNGTFGSQPATVAIDAVPGSIANAGPDQTAALGSTVALTGAASYDPSGKPLTFAWTVSSAPAPVTLSNPSSSAPIFTATAAGPYVFQLVVSANGVSGAPATVHVNVAAAKLTIYPATVNFPDQALDSSSAPQSITFLNSGTVPVTFSNFTATGDFSSHLTSTCGGTLAVGSLCSVSVTFSPTSLGTRSGVVSVANNVPVGPQQIALKGQAINSLATHLVFIAKPGTIAVNDTLPAVAVAVEDATGHIVHSTAAPVTLRLAANPGKALLGGTVTIKAIGGVATFTNLTINRTGVAYSLIATAPTLTSVTSPPFNVVAGAATHLVFLQPPTDIAPGAPFSPIVQVAAEDSFGNLVDVPASTVTVSIHRALDSFGDGDLKGVLTQPLIRGVAAFPALTVVAQKDSGAPIATWVLDAASTGLPTVRSISFRVLSPYLVTSGPLVGNDTVTFFNINLFPPSEGGEGYFALSQDVTVTITSSDPVHFLVTRDPTRVGAASVSYVKHKGDPDIFKDFVYVEGRNFSGTKVITSTLTVTAQGFVPATTPLQLYPTGLALTPVDDTVLVGGATARVGTVLQVLDPATLQSLPPSPYSSFPMLGPQAGPVTFSISNSTPAVGVFTSSFPAVFPVGASQVVSTFKALSLGTSSLRLAEPPGFVQPSDLNALLENVVPTDGFGIEAPPVGAHAVTPALLELIQPPTTPLSVTVTSSDPAHFLLATDVVNVPASASITLSFLPGQPTKSYIYVYGGNFTGKTPITATLLVSAPGHSTVSTPLTLFPTGLAFLTPTFQNCAGCFPSILRIQQVLLHPDTLTFFTGVSIHSGLTPERYAVSSSNLTVGKIIDSPALLPGGYDYGTVGAPSFVPHANGTTVLTLIPPPGYAIPANLPTQIQATVRTY